MKLAWSVCTLAACSVFVCCCAVAAPPIGRIEESRPSIYYLPDKDGNLQPVLGFDYSDFQDLYDLKNHLTRPDQPPQFHVEQIAVSGVALATYAQLSVRFHVLLRGNGWVRVPLRLDQGFLHGPVQYKGAGEQIVDSAMDDAGYVCWMRGKPGSRHEVCLTILVPLETLGDETRLNLRFPRTAAGEFKISVPLPQATATVASGAALAVTKRKTPTGPNSDGTTEFSVVGLPADFQLAWRQRKPAGEEPQPVLDVSGAVLARLDDRGVTSEATLTVRSLTAAFSHFTVRLPLEAKLLPDARIELAVGKVASAAAQGNVEVTLAKPTLGPVDLRVACRHECDLTRSESWCELSGFEVPGASRQAGAVALSAGDDWQLLFGPSRQTRPLDRLPEPLRKDGVVAGFEYFVAPYSLAVRLAKRAPRISVDPQYILLVDEDRVRLEAKLSYTIRGAKLSTLDLGLPGWTLDEIGPASIVRSDAAGQSASVPRQGDQIAVPLARPSSGVMEFKLRAHRPIPAGATSITVPLPQPRADSVAPAAVAVVPADNVEVRADSRFIKGLEPVAMLPMKLPIREQSPLCYRGDGGALVFAAQCRVLPPPVDSEIAPGSTLVDRAWYQTWLTPTSREDRAVFQLTTDRSHMELRLPAGAKGAEIEVVADGRRIEPSLAADNQLIVPLDSETRRHVVEVRYHFAGPRPAVGVLSLDLPRLDADIWARRIYWQLILPANEHLLTNPDGLAGEFVWGWDGYFWGRHPLLDETDLESWTGAVGRGRLPDQANRYLFSTLGHLERAEVRTASRTWIVLAASGLMLAVGLVFIRIPASRHPATLLALSVAFVAAALIAPEPTLLFAQAASLGMALVLFAAFLERRLASRQPRTSRKEFSGLRIELGSSRPTTVTPPRPNPSSTQTLLPTAPQATGEPES